jgi:hypothetical protein
VCIELGEAYFIRCQWYSEGRKNRAARDEGLSLMARHDLAGTSVIDSFTLNCSSKEVEALPALQPSTVISCEWLGCQQTRGTRGRGIHLLRVCPHVGIDSDGLHLCGLEEQFEGIKDL